MWWPKVKKRKQQQIYFLFPRTRSLGPCLFILSFCLSKSTQLHTLPLFSPYSHPPRRKREECGVAGDGMAFFKRNGAAWSFAQQLGDFWRQGERGRALRAQENLADVLWCLLGLPRLSFFIDHPPPTPPFRCCLWGKRKKKNWRMQESKKASTLSLR